MQLAHFSNKSLSFTLCLKEMIGTKMMSVLTNSRSCLFVFAEKSVDWHHEIATRGGGGGVGGEGRREEGRELRRRTGNGLRF